MAPFEGFPDNSEYTPVPNLLFGSLLEEIDDPLALKCFLRVLWLHSQKKGVRSVLTREEPDVGQDAGQSRIGIWRVN